MESAVIVPVLQADGLLRGWRPRWEPPAPVGIPACIWLAHPFLAPAELGPGALSGLAAIFGAQPPISTRIEQVSRRPGAVTLVPEPSATFAALAAQVLEAFPTAQAPAADAGAQGGELEMVALRSPDDALLDEAAADLERRLPLGVLIAEAWLVQAAGSARAWLVSEGTGERWTLRMRFPLGVNRY
jgi:hypothetical protein